MHQSFRSCLFAILVLGFSIVQASGAEPVGWTGWLGPQRNGWANSFTPPKQWPKQLQRKWGVDVGTGYGTPLVEGDRIYQHARQGEDEVVWCLDRETGSVIWRQSYAQPFQMGGGGQQHGKGPKACPVLADGRLVTFSITGILTAWDATSGEQIWRRDFSSEFKPNHPYWGASSSPIVDDGRLCIHLGNDQRGKLTMLHLPTGEIGWTNGKAGASYSSPLVAEIQGVRQVIQWNHLALEGVDVKTGQSLWSFSFPHVHHDQNMPTPTVFGEMIVLGAENRGIHGLEPKLSDGRWSVKEVWHQNSLALDMSSAVINDGLLFGFSHYDRGRLFCLDPRDGEIRWTGPPRTGENVAFLAMPGFVAALINNGKIDILQASGEGFQRVASYRVSDTQTWAPPVLIDRPGQDGGQLLVKDHATLTLWSIPR